MKKTFVILMMIITFCLPVFVDADAEYVPIPKELSKQYKVEIEQLIDERYPIINVQLKDIMNEALLMYNSVLKNKENYNEFCFNNFDMNIDSPVFYLYKDLIEVTQKYVVINKTNIPATDSSGDLYQFLRPYFIDNKINIKKLVLISKKRNTYQKKIADLYERSHKFIYSNEN